MIIKAVLTQDLHGYKAGATIYTDDSIFGKDMNIAIAYDINDTFVGHWFFVGLCSPIEQYLTDIQETNITDNVYCSLLGGIVRGDKIGIKTLNDLQ